MKPIIRKLGKVSITPQGDYDVGIDYKILDTINDNGKTFIAKKNVPKGTPTDNEEYWMEIASGKNATIQNVTATVDNHIGTPEVVVTLSGDEFNRVINLEFKNLKGDTGASINIISNLNSESELPTDGKFGDAYLVNGDLYLYVGQGGNVVSNPKWNNGGTIKFSYEDFTPKQIEDLKKPAYDAANEIQTDYNNNLKPAVIEATNNANAAITEANKQSTYAKEQGDYAKREADRISTLDLNIYRVVSDLPSIPSMTDEDKNKIYLKISVHQGEANKYDEYLVVNDAWELLGQYEAAIDLTEYVGKKELSSEIAELPALEDISKLVCIDENGKVAGVMTKEQVASVMSSILGTVLFQFEINFSNPENGGGTIDDKYIYKSPGVEFSISDYTISRFKVNHNIASRKYSISIAKYSHAYNNQEDAPTAEVYYSENTENSFYIISGKGSNPAYLLISVTGIKQ